MYRVIQSSSESNFRTLSILPKTPSVPIPSQPLIKNPRQPLIHFLSLWICLFWTFHINGILQYVTFCVWILSFSMMFWQFICIIAWISTLFLLLTNNIWIYHILIIHSPVDRHLGCFHFLAVMNRARNIHTQIHGHISSVLLGICLDMESQNHLVTMFNC